MEFKKNKNDFKETNTLKLIPINPKNIKWRCILSIDETFQMVAEWYKNFYQQKSERLYSDQIQKLSKLLKKGHLNESCNFSGGLERDFLNTLILFQTHD